MSRIYGLGRDLHRSWTRQRRLARPVLSVGGLSAGGAGKTPAAAWLAGGLAERGRQPVLLSRGWKRQGKGVEPVQPWSERAAERFGDEPVWLARRTGLPVIVGASRWDAGNLALESMPVGLFVLDDAFQHWALERDFDLVVLDASLDPESIELLPRGRWREDLGALRRASAVLLHRCNQAQSDRIEQWKSRIVEATDGRLGDRIFESEVVARIQGTPLEALDGRKVALASATASPESFERTALEAGMQVVEHLRLPDHAVLGESRLAELLGRAKRQGAEAIVVTEKDAVKLDLNRLGPLSVLSLAVDLKPRRPDALLLLVEAWLSLDGKET